VEIPFRISEGFRVTLVDTKDPISTGPEFFLLDGMVNVDNAILLTSDLSRRKFSNFSHIDSSLATT
jgi:hypothetical protein